MEEYRKGLLFAFAAALISGISVFANGEAVKLSDPFVYTALKNIGALALLSALALGYREIHHFKGLTRREWGTLALIGLIGGGIPFLLFFWGLKLGGAAVSSFIFRSLFIFAGVFGYLILRERPDRTDFLGASLILFGNALLVSGAMEFGPGQILVLGATILWALEYTISRKILSSVHPRVVMIGRMLFGSAFLLLFLGYQGGLGRMLELTTDMMIWLGVTSLLLSGFLVSWYGSLKRLPVLRAAAILSLGGVLSAILDAAFSSEAIGPAEGLGLLLLVIGVLAMVGVSEMLRSLRKIGEAVPGMVR